MRIARSFILGALLCVASAAFAQNNEPSISQSHDELLNRFAEILDASNIPGTQIALIEDGELSLTYSYGVSNVATGTPVTDETVFRAGSISKSFVSVAVMMAQEEGLLMLDASIAQIVPDVEFANAWEDDNPVTIAHVLEHTAGFYDLTLEDFIKSNPNISLEQGLAENPTTRVSRWSPGTYYSYTNSGPAIAAHALERVRDTSFDDLLRDTILRPLGMDVSDLRLTPRIEAQLSQSFENDGVTPVSYHHLLMRPSGTLNTTATELAQFVRMLINRGELDGRRYLTPQSVERMERSETLEAIDFYGLEITYGPGNNPQSTEKLVFRGHDGQIDGFLAYYAYSEELRAGVIILSNSTLYSARQGLIDAATDYLTRNFEPDLPAPYDVDDAELEGYAGFYVVRTPRWRRDHVLAPFEIPLRVSFEPETGLVVEGLPHIPNGEHTMRLPERAESSFARALGSDYRRELRYATVTFVQLSPWHVFQRIVFGLGTGLGAAMALGYAFVFIPIGIIRRLLRQADPDKRNGPQFMRTTTVLAGLCVAGIGVAFAYAISLHYLELDFIATITPFSLFLFSLSILAPLFALTGLWISITGDGTESWWKRSYFITANALILFGSAWLSQYGWIGLKTWTF